MEKFPLLATDLLGKVRLLMVICASNRLQSIAAGVPEYSYGRFCRSAPMRYITNA